MAHPCDIAAPGGKAGCWGDWMLVQWEKWAQWGGGVIRMSFPGKCLQLTNR